jgi:hypothetical protein
MLRKFCSQCAVRADRIKLIFAHVYNFGRHDYSQDRESGVGGHIMITIVEEKIASFVNPAVCVHSINKKQDGDCLCYSV